MFSVSFLLVILMSGVCFFCIRIFLIVCAGSVGISLAGRVMYLFRVSLFCEIGGPVQFYSVTVVEWTAGLYRFSFFSGSIAVGTVRVKW